MSSVDVPAALVKELRERTGAGLMECKRALQQTNGDLDAAQKLLREKGIASAAKRAERATPEGLVGYMVDGTVAAMVAVGCETEPVAKNAEFRAFADGVLRAVLAAGPAAVDGLEDERKEVGAKLGENVVVRGAVRFEGADGDTMTGYVHPPANKLGVLLHTRGNPELARQLAMQIAWAAPRYLERDDVPAAEVDAEREILGRQPDVEGKPEHVRDRIVEGRLEKWYAASDGASVLADQEWIHEPGRRVGDVLREARLEVVDFRRFALE